MTFDELRREEERQKIENIRRSELWIPEVFGLRGRSERFRVNWEKSGITWFYHISPSGIPFGPGLPILALDKESSTGMGWEPYKQSFVLHHNSSFVPQEARKQHPSLKDEMIKAPAGVGLHGRFGGSDMGFGGSRR